jgi:ATP-binding cassette, subfamily C, bacterial
MHEPAILKLLREGGHSGQALLLTVLALGTAASEGLGLLLVVPLLDGLGADQTRLGWLLGLFVILALARALLGHARQLTAVRLRGEVVDGLRSRAWDALLHCDWRVLREARRSASASLLISDIDRLGAALSEAFSALALGATLVAVLGAGLLIAPLPVLALGLLGLALLPLLRRSQDGAARLGERTGHAYAALHAASSGALAGLRTIKALTAEAPVAAQIDAAQAGLRQAEQGYWRMQGLAQLALQFGAALGLALFVWLMVTRGGASAAQLVPLVAVVVRAVPLGGAVHQAWLQWSHARPALTSLEELLTRFGAARESEGEAVAPTFARVLQVEAATVRFAANGPQVLDAVSLALPFGSITALTGPSGAGKTTLADLLGGLIAPDAGALQLDGVPLDPAARRGWRRRVAYVAQEPVLFAGTVRENLLLAVPEADGTRLIQVLTRAAADFVFALPGGLDCSIGDGGRSLSGGEVQRLLLARALLTDPALLILDEATSALDPANEALIAAALEGLRGQVTVVIIAHHGALSALADQTIKLDCGRVTTG